MKRKNIIVIGTVSIIVIVVLILGFTYAYIGDTVTGNEKKRTVLIDTQNSSIEYTDLTEETTEKTIEPGFEDIRLFTVKNVGNVSVNYNIYLDEVVNDFVRTQDLVYTLYKKSGENSIDTNKLNPNDIVSTGILPKNKSYIMLNELINEKDIYTYAFKVTYVNSEENQDVNKGCTFEFKIQIDGEMQNFFNENSLAYNILNNAINVSDEQANLGYAKLDIKSNLNNSVLSIKNDDYSSSYYFKGNVINNYLSFANKCWRIVRIEGDGSIKLVLEDNNQVCSNEMDGNWNIGTGNYGYESISDTINTTYINPISEVNESQIKAYYDFQNSLGNSNLLKLKTEDWCLDRLSNNTYKCNGLKINEFQEITNNEEKIINNDNMLVGALTYDEIFNAGEYLLNEYQVNNKLSFWTMTNEDNLAYYVNDKLELNKDKSNNKYSFRPAVTLINNISYRSGNGSIENPYIVE